jgi:DNA-binding PadR family transcriptional regulator
MAMGELTPLGVAALALLVERPMHPYEMYQTLVTRAEDRLVKVRPGSLYHAVERLTRQGFVESMGTDREGNRPERTTYRITESGQLSLSERVADMIANPINEYPEFPLAVAEAHNLSKEIFIELLGRRRVRLLSELETLRIGFSDVTEKKIPKKFWIDITYQEAMVNAEIAWIDATVHDLTSGELDWTPGPHFKNTPHEKDAFVS